MKDLKFRVFKKDDIKAVIELINKAYRENNPNSWTSEAHLLNGIRVNEHMLNEILENKNILNNFIYLKISFLKTKSFNSSSTSGNQCFDFGNSIKVFVSL